MSRFAEEKGYILFPWTPSRENWKSTGGGARSRLSSLARAMGYLKVR